MSVGKKIKELRQKAGLSQAEVAEKLGMARATYASLEVDRREPDLGELKAISQFYEIEMMELIAEEGDDWPGVVMEPPVEYKTRKEPSVVPRDIDPQVNPDKLREVLLYVLEKIGAKPNVGETVLYKLLYFIDFDYYEKNGQAITGLTYIRSRFGPTPTRSLGDLVKQMEQNGELEIVLTKNFNNTMKKFLPVVSSTLTELTAGELRHIDVILGCLGDKNATQLLQLVQIDTFWRATDDGQKIRYQNVVSRESADDDLGRLEQDEDVDDLLSTRR